MKVNHDERIGQIIHGWEILKLVTTKGGAQYNCRCAKCGIYKVYKWYNLLHLKNDYCEQCNPRKRTGKKVIREKKETRCIDWASVMRGWILR